MKSGCSFSLVLPEERVTGRILRYGGACDGGEVRTGATRLCGIHRGWGNLFGCCSAGWVAGMCAWPSLNKPNRVSGEQEWRVLWICGAVVTVTSSGDLPPFPWSSPQPPQETDSLPLWVLVSPEVDLSQLCKAGNFCLPVLQIRKLWLRDVK